MAGGSTGLRDEHRCALSSAVPLPALLGYVNFSTGKADGRFQKQLSDAFALLAERGESDICPALYEILGAELTSLHQTQTAFRDAEQAQAVLDLVFQGVLLAYRRHHADLLFHLSETELFQPFFLARAFEAVLAQRGPWNEKERIIRDALRQLNDYVGHRPIALLESRPRGEPYDHERLRPIPLYIEGAGVAWGSYRALVEAALGVLKGTDLEILQDAYFEPNLIEELSLDPRGYDFGHPVDKRPNYMFGEWDPHHIDNHGRYRRLVVRKVVLDALLQRVTSPGELDAGEALWEGAAVLAGTILMATGISGAGPDTHDSGTNLSSLLPRIARYREAFYENLLKTRSGPHGERLRQESVRTRQPFGGARQHLNHAITQERARQLQQRHLALLFADIGYPEASRRHAQAIPVASVRLLTEMHLQLAVGRLRVQRGELAEAVRLLPEVEDFLRRGIDCGAVVDPWNILGFQAQFPRFTTLEDSVRDRRIDELVGLVEQILNLYAQVLSEGAAAGTHAGRESLLRDMRQFADWWDRFATVEVSDVPRVHGGEAAASAEHVSLALSRWRERGTASADLAFWREHLQSFNSPKAFALVIEALLRKEDYRASMALLVTWLGQAEQAPLEEGEHSFHVLALRWMLGVCGPVSLPGDEQQSRAATRLDLIAKFFDHLEANAEDYWSVPRLDVLGAAVGPETQETSGPEDDLYEAAYEDVTYEDSTDDEVEAEVLDFMPQKDFDLTAEAERLEKHVRFLSTLARLWNIAARATRLSAPPNEVTPGSRWLDWLSRACVNQQGLSALMDTIHEHEIPKPSGSYESLVEFDRRNVLKERLLGAIIGTCLDTALAIGALQGAAGATAVSEEQKPRPAWEPAVLSLEQALWRGEAEQVRAVLPSFLKDFQQEPLLFTPLAQGGTPREVLRANFAQSIMYALAAALPRLGLVRDTYQVVQSAFTMERSQSAAGPHVTGFDRLFQAACQATVEAVLDAAAGESTSGIPSDDEGERVATVLEEIIEPFLNLWIEHSKTMRVSTLERLSGDESWQSLRQFIERYGNDIFQQRFMTLANLRGILNRGVGAYLDYASEHADQPRPERLLEELEKKIAREQAVRCLEIILQTIVENYEEYRDYNSTTAQSDFGANLYRLLDFLRLKASYDRNAWQLRPLNVVHEVLARRHPRAADFWRVQVRELTRELADDHARALERLEQEHGMRLPAIAERIGERFSKPLEIDRLCALVEPAMDQARQLSESTPLETELRPFTDHPSGAGLDLPVWLRRLQAEVERVRNSRTDLARLAESMLPVPRVAVTLEDLRGQFKKVSGPFD